jgi:hypothetical protein
VTTLVTLAADLIAKTLVAAIFGVSVLAAIAAVGFGGMTELTARGTDSCGAHAIRVPMTLAFAADNLVTKRMTETALSPAPIGRMMSSAMLASQALVMIELTAHSTRFSLAYLIGMSKLTALIARDLGAKVKRVSSIVTETTRSLSHGW